MNLFGPVSRATSRFARPEVDRHSEPLTTRSLLRGVVTSDLPGDAASLLSIVSFVIWLGCLIVGLLGMIIPYPRPPVPEPVRPPVQAAILKVELTNDPMLPAEAGSPPTEVSQPPPPLDVFTPPPAAPPLLAVAEPSPVIAFAMPINGPVRTVESQEAVFIQENSPAAAAAVATPTLPVRAITYGQGEGKQPAPQYPAQARRERQEGMVGVRFSVGEDGRVLAAEVSMASLWPLLNESALRVVRERWRFQPGARRLYEVSIRFELTK